MLKAWAGLALALVASAAWADDVKIAPPEDWVKPLALPAPPTDTNAAAIRFVLQDMQTRFGPDGDETYAETAVKFQTPQGLAAGTVAIPWNPETDVLTVHKVHIVRGDQVIDVLGAGQTFTVLRRETSLELATLDGVLTAALQPEGLQVGDVLDIAYTLKRHDPALQGRSQYMTGDVLPVPVQRLHIRQVWPTAKDMRWKEMEGLAPAVVTKTADGGELVIDMTNAERPKPPKLAPPRYAMLGLIETSEFATWADVSSVMAPLYDKAATLKPDSTLKAEAAKIRAASPDPKAQAAAALRLVQDQVRYVYLGINDGGYVPAAADTTWARRFGDCKGKTVLLLALLRELGIQAQPAMVNSNGADGLDATLPTTLMFDHVLIKAVVGGKTYWLDGTRTGDRSLDAVTVPAFDWALPVQMAGAKLERLDAPPAAAPMSEMRLKLDASAGLDAPATAHFESIITGDLATGMKLGLDAMSSADREQHLREYWKTLYTWVDIKSVDSSFDEATGQERLSVDGTLKLDWPADGGSAGPRVHEPEGSGLGWQADFSRDSGPHQDAPYAVPYPAFIRTSETIVLPHDGAGFSLSGPDVHETVAGREFTRKATIDHGLFSIETDVRSVVREFPASEAVANTAKMKALAQQPLYLRAPRWYRPTDAEIDARAKATPTDAGGFLDRADAFVQKGDFDHALADADAAVTLKPHDAGVLNARCFIRGEANKNLPAALDDCNEALKLAPRDPPTLDSRGFVYFRLGQFDRAIADYDAALDVDQTMAPSLYIRGLARRHQGDAKGGDADIAAAKAQDPNVAATYGRLGVTP